jgi:DNA-binding NarL/FixJ family response regulator
MGSGGVAQSGEEWEADERWTGADGQPCRVLIVDRSLVFAEGIAVLLRSAGIDAQATSVDTLADAWAAQSFTVLVIDGDPDERFGDALAEANVRRSSTPVLLLLDEGRRHADRSVVATGSATWLSRHADPKVLIETILALHKHGHVGQPGLRRLPAPGNHELPLVGLTDRELAVVRMLAQALDNETIGKSLGISANTVRTHIRNLLLKLNAHSRAEAVATAARCGLINGQEPAGEGAAGCGCDQEIAP